MNNTKNDPAVGCPLERRVMPILLHGDCLDLMATIESGIDMILCDLPYGTTACKWDTVIPFDALWAHYKRVIKPNGAIVLFGVEPFSSSLRSSNLKMYRYDWVWVKERGQNFANAKKQPMRSHEMISVFYPKQPTYNPIMTPAPTANIRKPQYHTAHKSEVYGMNKMPSIDYDATMRYPLSCLNFNGGRARDKMHPTQKPVALCEYLIRTYTNEGETVLDNCMGSGTTGIACLNTGRNFIGIEKDQKYFEIARNRSEGHNAEVSGLSTRPPGYRAGTELGEK